MPVSAPVCFDTEMLHFATHAEAYPGGSETPHTTSGARVRQIDCDPGGIIRLICLSLFNNFLGRRALLGQLDLLDGA